MEIIACKLVLFKPNNWYHKSRDQRRKREINCNCFCAINRQNYAPWQYGPPSLNSSPELICDTYVLRICINRERCKEGHGIQLLSIKKEFRQELCHGLHLVISIASCFMPAAACVDSSLPTVVRRVGRMCWSVQCQEGLEILYVCTVYCTVYMHINSGYKSRKKVLTRSG